MAKRPRAPKRPKTAHTREWPLFRSLAAYRPEYLTGDLVAGLTLAAIAIPEQMATAGLGHFEPQVGLVVMVAGALAFAIFGGSRFLSCGADSTITPIFYGGLVAGATTLPENYFVLAAALALMVGVLLVAAGIFRLGWIADLLSVPVTTGFLAGIAAHILISQLPGVLGLDIADGPMLKRLAAIVGELGNTNWITLVIGAGVLAVIIVSEKIDGRIPGALIGLVVATVAVAVLGLDQE